jgi:tetratricopeptide (TPR) repeat protein
MATVKPIPIPASVAPTRINLVWGLPRSAPAPWLLGLFCFYRRAKSSSTGEYYVPVSDSAGNYPFCIILSVRGFLCWSLALLLTAHLAVTGGLYSIYKKKPHNQVQYADLALPWRWSGISALRGQAVLIQAKADFAARNYSDAYGALRAGLNRYPKDNAARIQLATLYLAGMRRNQSDGLLLEALKHGDPGPDFNRAAVAYIKDSDRPERVLEFVHRARELVADDKRRGEHLRFLASAEAETLLESGRPAEAIAVVEALRPPQAELTARIRTQAVLQSQGAAAAIPEVLTWLAVAPQAEVPVAMAVGLYRQAGQFAEMDATLKRLKDRNPTNPSFASMGVVQNLLANRTEAARAAFDDCLQRFDSDAATLETLARDIGRTGRLELLVPLEQVMREHGFDTQMLLFSRLLGQLDNADWAGAKITQQALAARTKTLIADVRVFNETAGPLIALCSQDAAASRVALLDRVSRYGGRLKLYNQFFDCLFAAQQWSVANDVLTLAEGAFPRSVQLEERRVRLAPHLAVIAAAEAAANEAAKLVRQASSANPFPDAAVFFEAFKKEKDAGQVAAALRLVQALRRSEPSWLPGSAEQVDLLELEMVLSLDDRLQLQSVLRTYLRFDRSTRNERVCELAKTAHAAGQLEVAEMLVREVLRRAPGDVTALDLRKAWEPKPAAPVPTDPLPVQPQKEKPKS